MTVVKQCFSNSSSLTLLPGTLVRAQSESKDQKKNGSMQINYCFYKCHCMFSSSKFIVLNNRETNTSVKKKKSTRFFLAQLLKLQAKCLIKSGKLFHCVTGIDIVHFFFVLCETCL